MHAYWIEYARRVRELESQGMDTSDAQGVVDAQDMAAGLLDDRGIPFALANDPPPHIPAQFDNQTACAQRKLISGLNCLPGQMELF
jgi:hypothetical protein